MSKKTPVKSNMRGRLGIKLSNETNYLPLTLDNLNNLNGETDFENDYSSTFTGSDSDDDDKTVIMDEDDNNTQMTKTGFYPHPSQLPQNIRTPDGNVTNNMKTPSTVVLTNEEKPQIIYYYDDSDNLREITSDKYNENIDLYYINNGRILPVPFDKRPRVKGRNINTDYNGGKRKRNTRIRKSLKRKTIKPKKRKTRLLQTKKHKSKKRR